MTIAKRMFILWAVPLPIVLALGVYVITELSKVEVRSRFVAENQVGSLVPLANITRSVSELRANVRSCLLTDDDRDQDHTSKGFEEETAALTCQPVIRFTDITVRQRNEQARATGEDLSV